MRKGTFIATIALLIAIAGAIVAFAAYFKRRSCALCDDLDDELMDDMSDLDYYATQVDEDDEEDVWRLRMLRAGGDRPGCRAGSGRAG